MRFIPSFQRLATITALTVTASVAQADDCLDLGVTLCADWSVAGDVWSAHGDVEVQTPLGPFRLANADVEAQLDPPALTGTVDLPLPDLGILAEVGFEGSAPRAEIALGYGEALEEIEIGGQPMALDPEDTYLMFDYDTAFSASFGPMSVTSGGSASTLVIGPNEPLLYMAGDLLDLMPTAPIRNVALGISFDGRLPWESENPLWDGDTLEPRTLDGHLLVEGDIKLGRYPIWVHGHTIYDLDADNDGEALSDARDFRFGSDSAVDVSLSVGEMSLDLPLARASVIYDASQGEIGHVAFYAQDGGNVWADTPLEFIQPSGDQQTLYGYFHDTDDFAVHYERVCALAGFPAGQVQVELGSDGAWVLGTLQPMGLLPEVEVEGEIRRSGQVRLRGTADMEIAGIPLANAEFTVKKRSVSMAARAQLPLVGSIDLDGTFSANGQIALNGRADLTLAGYTLSDATVRLDNGGIWIEGEAQLGPFGRTTMSGSVTANGQFELEGAVNVDMLGLNVSNARARISNDGARIEARLNLGVATFDLEGSFEANGDFDLNGAARVRVAGFDLGVMEARVSKGFRVFNVNLSGTVVPLPLPYVEVDLSGRASLPGVGSVRLEGGMRQTPLPLASRPFSLSGSANVRIAGLNISSGKVKVSSSKVEVEGRVQFAGSRVKVKGRLRSNGSFDMEGSVHIDEGFSIAGTGVSVEGSMTVEIDDGDLDADMDGKVCAKINYGFGSHKECAGFGVGVNSRGEIRVKVPVIGTKTIDIW
jgi:hypothetical protein